MAGTHREGTHSQPHSTDLLRTIFRFNEQSEWDVFSVSPWESKGSLDSEPESKDQVLWAQGNGRLQVPTLSVACSYPRWRPGEWLWGLPLRWIWASVCMVLDLNLFLSPASPVA
jgi:hypothetical protein